MTVCKHSVIALLPEKKNLLRCRHCHLTIKADELVTGYCPECFEVSGRKQCDFEEMAVEEKGPARYRCEECGVIIESV
jgi:predicted RNA-binding Zn-ribbon protein involved in translation (DUF1610 family)